MKIKKINIIEILLIMVVIGMIVPVIVLAAATDNNINTTSNTDMYYGEVIKIPRSTGIGSGSEQGGGEASTNDQMSIGTTNRTGTKVSLLKIPKDSYYQGELIHYMPYSTGFNEDAPNVTPVGTAEAGSYVSDYPIYIIDSSAGINEELYWTESLFGQSKLYTSDISDFMVDPSKPASTYGLDDSKEINYENYYKNFDKAFVNNWYNKIPENHIANELGLHLSAALNEIDDNDPSKIHMTETQVTILQLMANVYLEATGEIPQDIANALDPIAALEYDYCIMVEPLAALGSGGQYHYITPSNYAMNTIRESVPPEYYTPGLFKNSAFIRSHTNYNAAGGKNGWGWPLYEMLGRLVDPAYPELGYTNETFIGRNIYYDGPVAVEE